MSLRSSTGSLPQKIHSHRGSGGDARQGAYTPAGLENSTRAASQMCVPQVWGEDGSPAGWVSFREALEAAACL